MSFTNTIRARLPITAIGAAVLATVAILALSTEARAATRAATVTVTAGKPSEFGFRLSTKTVTHGTVTFKVTNGGQIPHDFKICTKGGTANACTGSVTKLLSPGQSATLTHTFKTKGSYEYLCTVPGHAAGGMKGDLKVT
jgi:uncharacterized cupredoxin-like copper-binding protein